MSLQSQKFQTIGKLFISLSCFVTSCYTKPHLPHFLTSPIILAPVRSSRLFFRLNPSPLQSLIPLPSLSCLPSPAETSAEWSYCCVSLHLSGAALQGPADWIRAFYSLWVDHREQMQIATSVESVQRLTQDNNAVWLRVKSQPAMYCRKRVSLEKSRQTCSKIAAFIYAHMHLTARGSRFQLK